MDRTVPPDVINRGDRTRQLVLDAARIKTQIRTDIKASLEKDDETFELLNGALQIASFQNLQEFENQAFQKLADEDRDALMRFAAELEQLDRGLFEAHTVFRGIFAFLALFARKPISLQREFNIQLEQDQALIFGLQAVCMAVFASIEGDGQASGKLAEWGIAQLERAAKATLRDNGEGLELLKRGPAFVDGGARFIDQTSQDVAKEVDERPDFREAIVIMCSQRFALELFRERCDLLREFHEHETTILNERAKHLGFVQREFEAPEEAEMGLRELYDDFVHEMRLVRGQVPSHWYLNAADTAGCDPKSSGEILTRRMRGPSKFGRLKIFPLQISQRS